MKRNLFALLTALLALASAPLAAGAGSFTLINGTGSALDSLAYHRFGASGWRPLAAAIAPGGRAPIAFNDPDCAFDIRANIAGGGTATWSAVNLCEVRVVILRRNAAGETWAEYE